MFKICGRFVNVSRVPHKSLGTTKDGYLSVSSQSGPTICISTGIVTASYLKRCTAPLVRHGIYIAMDPIHMRRLSSILALKLSFDTEGSIVASLSQKSNGLGFFTRSISTAEKGIGMSWYFFAIIY